MMKSAFFRSLGLAAAMSALMGSGLSHAMAAAQSGAANYKSRGKGRSSSVSPAFVHRRAGKAYPFSSTKQHNKHATRQITVMRNGFPVMNTLKAKDRLSMSQVA